MKLVTLTNDGYASGTAILLESIKRNGKLKTPEFTVVTLEPLSAENKTLLAATEVPITYIDGRTLPKFQIDTCLLMQQRRIPNLTKLSMFCLPQGKYCFIDSDVMCLRDISDMDKFSHFSAAPQIGMMGPESINGRPSFNSGVFVFEADKDMFDEMQRWWKKNVRRLVLSDQEIFNRFMYDVFPDEVHLMGLEYNTLMGLRLRHKYLWMQFEKTIKLMHFTSMKPWKQNPRDRNNTEHHKMWYDMLKEVKARISVPA